MDWLWKFPSMDEDLLRALKKSVDEGFVPSRVAMAAVSKRCSARCKAF
jgi:hypothetical protein